MRQCLFVVMLAMSALFLQLQAVPALAEAPTVEVPLTLEQATARLHAKVGGRVLGAKAVQVEEVGRVYEIKILLKPGKVKVYWVNPVTGKIL